MNDEDDILAAEFALGLLDGAEAQSAQARARTDAAFSLRIAWWRDQLAPLVREVETPAPKHVWSRIAAQLPVNEPANDNASSASRWKWATAAMATIAAILLAMIVLQPAPAPVVDLPLPTAPEIVASVSGENGAAVTIAYQQDAQQLLITPVVLDPGNGDAELWVIPIGKTVPVSLGVIDAKTARVRNIDPVHAMLLQPGATFAISQEAKGGSPTGAPAGPIVATGKIIRV